MSSLGADLKKRADVLASRLEASKTLRDDIKEKRVRLAANEQTLAKRRTQIRQLAPDAKCRSSPPKLNPCVI